MPTIVGVKIRSSARPLYYEVSEPAPEHGDAVIVKTDRGQEFGHVVAGPQEPDATTVRGAMRREGLRAHATWHQGDTSRAGTPRSSDRLSGTARPAELDRSAEF